MLQDGKNKGIPGKRVDQWLALVAGFGLLIIRKIFVEALEKCNIMLIADIRKKLTLNERTSEDFLTSSFFSFFRYLPDNYFESFLKGARNIEGDCLDLDIQNPEFIFWPYYKLDKKYGNGAVPDLVVFSENVALIIEAKNFSGKSGIGFAELEEPKSEEEKKSKEIERERLYLIDQLGREYFVGKNKLSGKNHRIKNRNYEIKDFFVLFVTRHDKIPIIDIEETLESIKKINALEFTNASKKIFWINWSEITPLLNDILSQKEESDVFFKIASDLKEFLDRRDLIKREFSGFSFLKNYSFGKMCGSFYNPREVKYFSFKKLDLFSDWLGTFYYEKEEEYWTNIDTSISLPLKKISKRKNIFYGG